MKSSRRSFLRTALTVPALAYAPSSGTSAVTVAHDSTFDPWVEIRSANMQHNAEEVSRRVGRRPILAVIKNNGYGAGVVNAAKASSASTALFCFHACRRHLLPEESGKPPGSEMYGFANSAACCCVFSALSRLAAALNEYPIGRISAANEFLGSLQAVPKMESLPLFDAREALQTEITLL